MSPQSPLAWSFDADGTSTRRLDALEMFFKTLADSGVPINREHWLMTFPMRLSFPDWVKDPAPYLRAAWRDLRRLHPGLAGVAHNSTSDPSGAQVLTVAPMTTESCLSDTFFQNDDMEGWDDLVASHHITKSAQCHWIPRAREVCIVTSHWRVDGVGLVMLANRFLKVLATRLGSDRDRADDSFYALGVGPLSPSLDEIVGLYTDKETTPSHIRAAADGLVAELAKGFPSVGLPTTPGSKNAVPGPTRRVTAYFDTETTNAIVRACKTRGWSASLALHAAIVRVTASYAQHPLAKNYGAILAVDLRRFLPEPYSLEEYAVGMFASGIPVVVENAVGKSFEGIVADLDKGYRRDVTRICEDGEGRPVSLLELTAPYIRRTMELFASPPPPGMPLSQNPGLSSLGRLDKFLAGEHPVGPGGSRGRLILEDMGIGMGALGRALECHSWTFNGRLTLSASYNTSFYEVDFVEEVLGKVRCELLVGLGLMEKLQAKL